MNTCTFFDILIMLNMYFLTRIVGPSTPLWMIDIHHVNVWKMQILWI